MRAALSLLILAFSPLAARAQSFDCKLAQSPREQAICADTRLSALDAEIAANYESLRAQLSPESAALVESDQREWLRWIDLVCPANGHGIVDDPAACLQNEYLSRLHDLQQTAHLGTAVLYPRAHFLYKALEDEAMKAHIPNYRGFGYGTLRWPQIDIKPDIKPDINPDIKPDRPSASLTPAEAAWNAAITATAAKLAIGLDASENATFDSAVEPLESINARYTVEAANDRLVDITLLDVSRMDSSLWTLTFGAKATQYPLTVRSSFLWWLDRNRELTVDDIFLPSSGWQDHLVSLATARLQADPKLKPLLREEPMLLETVDQSIRNSSNWTVTRDGLTITFLEGMVAGNPAGMPQVHFTWDELKPYLEPTLNPSTLPAPPPHS